MKVLYNLKIKRQQPILVHVESHSNFINHHLHHHRCIEKDVYHCNEQFMYMMCKSFSISILSTKIFFIQHFFFPAILDAIFQK